MPTITTTRAEMPTALSLRVVTDFSAEEKRSASPLEDDDDIHTASPHNECSTTSDDERSASIPTTAELEPLDDATSELITYAIQNLTTHEDWLQQHEAITVLRRALVHHTRLLSDAATTRVLVPALICACDNLRSALAKNALLALGECCAFLGLTRLESFLVPEEDTTARGRRALVPFVDVLLRRSVCEKRFLCDAARVSVDQLIAHLASPALIAAAAGYAANRNAKVVATASRLMAQSFARLRGQWDATLFGPSVYGALAKFRAGKDGAARAESAACLRQLGEALGRARFESALQDALRDSAERHSVAAIVAEVFPAPADGASAHANRRGSLRDRMLLQQQHTQQADNKAT